ncbi:MAG: response regulator transcription factor [Candidatus Omnitrophica bacterium]|nr:response regulator transcription factor [Candidatus Omnitrophota bacterium]
MTRQKILIVEDDPHILKLVQYNLEKAGFECRTAAAARQAFEELDRQKIHLIVLDVMLPGMDGFELCKEIKKKQTWAAIPVLMLTARAEEIDRVLGLELGADDYMVKPFSPRELVLRIKAILRRGEPKETRTEEVLAVGKLTVDKSRHKVLAAGREVPLTPMEFKLLVLLMERRGRLQSRERLLSDVWDIDADVTTRTVDTHVKCLRRKLGKMGQCIETVRGYGYRLRDEEFSGE